MEVSDAPLLRQRLGRECPRGKDLELLERITGTIVELPERTKGTVLSPLKVDHIPMLQRIHQLPRRLQTFPHQMCLLPDDIEGFIKQPGLIFQWRWGGRHEVVH